jgi:hypothetical protein
MRLRRLKSSQSTLKDTERRDIMGFTFKVTFNEKGDVIQAEHNTHGGRPGDTTIATYDRDFTATAPAGVTKIPIDLDLFVMKEDDPCIRHKGKLY